MRPAKFSGLVRPVPVSRDRPHEGSARAVRISGWFMVDFEAPLRESLSSFVATGRSRKRTNLSAIRFIRKSRMVEGRGGAPFHAPDIYLFDTSRKIANGVTEDTKGPINV